MFCFFILPIVICNAHSFLTDTNNNPFGDFRLGAGFDMTTYQPKGAHIFREDAESLKYDIMPITNTKTSCVTINKASELSDKLGVKGSLSITYNMITGKGSMEFDQREEKMERKSYYSCTVDRTLFTISVNAPYVDSEMEESEKYAMIPKDLALLNDDDRRTKIGDYHVRSITYGRRYKTEIAFTYKNDDTFTKISGELEAKIGIGALSVAAKVSISMESKDQTSDLKISVGSQSYGFIEPSPLIMPTTKDADQAATQMMKLIDDNLKSFNDLDNFTVNAQTNLSKAQLFNLIGDAYPLSYTVEENSRYFPPLVPLTAKEEKQMIKNIDEAYDILRELEDIYESVNMRAEAMFENYHLLSGDSTLSEDFLNIRKDFIDKVMQFQTEVNEWLEQNPKQLAAKNVYYWARDRPSMTIEPLSIDFLHMELWDLLGMEDYPMNAHEDALGAVCLFNGIQAVVNHTRKKFAGRVLFSDEVVRHVIFDHDQDIVSLGFVDHTDDIKDGKWIGKTHELVYVRDDCTLLRNGSTVWYENSRYTISKVGSEQHLTKEGRVVKEELTNIRIHLKPEDTTREKEVIITDKEIKDVTLRGVEHSYDLTIDNENRLMYSNGYVCDTGFSMNEANLVCTHLGYSRMESFSTRTRIPTSNAWRRPFITLFDMNCPEFAMKLNECEKNTDKTEIDWDKCGDRNGIEIKCTNANINGKTVSVEISSTTNAGCRFDAHDVGLKRDTANVCYGGEGDSADSFGWIEKIYVEGDVCVKLSKGNELQCVIPAPPGGVYDLQDLKGQEDLQQYCYSGFDYKVFPDHVDIVWEASNHEDICEDNEELLKGMSMQLGTCQVGKATGFCDAETAPPTFTSSFAPTNATATEAPRGHLNAEDNITFLAACQKTCGTCSDVTPEFYDITVVAAPGTFEDWKSQLLRGWDGTGIEVKATLVLDNDQYEHTFTGENEANEWLVTSESRCSDKWTIKFEPENVYSHGSVTCGIHYSSVKYDWNAQTKVETGFVDEDVKIEFVCQYPESASPTASPSTSPSVSPTLSPSVSPTTSYPTTSPTFQPSNTPIVGTTIQPSKSPTSTIQPSKSPTSTIQPSKSPTSTIQPSKSPTIVSCRMTIDNAVTSIQYGGNELDFTGDPATWRVPKFFSFTPVEGQALEIYGYESGTCNGCQCAGLLLECDNGFTSNLEEWSAVGSDSAITATPTSRFGSVCETSSGFSLTGQTSNAVQIWPDGGEKYAWFRTIPVPLVPYHFIDGGDCEQGDIIASAADCQRAAAVLGFTIASESLSGTWTWVPQGCFVHEDCSENCKLHYGTGTGSNDGRYRAICHAETFAFITEGTCETNGMRSIHDAFSCGEAARFFQKDFSDVIIVETDFDDERPTGCSWHEFGNVELWLSSHGDCVVNGFAGCFCFNQEPEKEGF